MEQLSHCLRTLKPATEMVWEQLEVSCKWSVKWHENCDTILGLQSISRDEADNVCHPRWLNPTMELITYSFVLYLQHGCRDVKCKPSICQPRSQGLFLNWGREKALASAGLFCNPIGSFKLSIKSFKSIIYS